MEQIVNIANQLIACIVNIIFFLVSYGMIFYVLGSIIYEIGKTLYERIRPFWKKWYQHIKHK